MAGLGQQWIDAAWKDDRDLIETASVVAARIRKEEREDLASLTARKIVGGR
jgi:hypothetical protein